MVKQRKNVEQSVPDHIAKNIPAWTGNLTGKKRGNLSLEEMAFIRKYIDELPVEKMARLLNRNPEPIRRYIQGNRLGREYVAIVEEEKKGEHAILADLRSKPFYRDLQSHFSNSERTLFNEYWVAMVMQFNGDLIPSEEMELKELLTLEILKNRETAAEKARLEEKAFLEKELRLLLQETNKDDKGIRALRESISSIQSQSFQYIRNFKDLCDRADKMRKALHASRLDRVKDLENSRINFTAWLKMLEEHGNKVRVAKEMEIIRQAKDRAYEKFANYHTYADGEVDLPILNAETIMEVEPSVSSPDSDEKE